MSKPKYRGGTTNRIVVTSVREDPCDIPGDTPEGMYRYWNEIIVAQPDFERDKESVVVVMHNTRMRPFAWHRVSLGTINEAPVHCRELLRPVIVAGAYAFVIMHNHPSGDPSPSEQDRHMTRRAVEAANLLQIKLLDHLIIGDPAPQRTPYFSFREAGLMS